MILQKYLSHKGFFVSLCMLYIISIFMIVIGALLPLGLPYTFVEGLYEKDVQFFHVFSQNMILISKTMIFGLLTCGLYAFYILIHNAVTLICIENVLVHKGFAILALKMVPHGLIEILGIVLVVNVLFYIWYQIGKSIGKIVKRELPVGIFLRKELFLWVNTYILEMILFFAAGGVEVWISRIKFFEEGFVL